jgi:hypothetical protein
MILLNPKQYDGKDLDDRSRELMLKTIEFFERKGKVRLKRDDRERVWYEDFLDFVKGPSATASSTRSRRSTRCTTGTRGRSPSWGWGRCG